MCNKVPFNNTSFQASIFDSLNNVKNVSMMFLNKADVESLSVFVKLWSMCNQCELIMRQLNLVYFCNL
jgi:hypothetical protein